VTKIVINVKFMCLLNIKNTENKLKV